MTPKPNDVLLRIVDLVENGNVPQFLTGTKYVNGDPEQGVQLAQVDCKYPARNVYVGPQNYTLPDGWKCVKDSIWKAFPELQNHFRKVYKVESRISLRFQWFWVMNSAL
jgi:hypothetical protein